ncbi:MAG: DNA-directed RNA polymerase subunit beta [Bifidobacteriaceae bacterium]|jgi:DNA-directed RNA polymerase subunit beta|nr:DNA-directed RNA polymerase subunit beta [Bifidobacteriaceae bacterium]
MATKKVVASKKKKAGDVALSLEDEIKLHKRANRVSFGRSSELKDVPYLLSIQRESYDWLIGNEFFKKRIEKGTVAHHFVPSETSGLEEVLEEISPIEDYSKTMSLSFSEPQFENPRYSERECKEHGYTYSAPLYVSAEFVNNDTGEIKTQTVFFGDFPLMTKYGTFIVNGAERVIVSQLVRSPGVYYESTLDKVSDQDLYSVRVIPTRGAWFEFEYDRRGVLGVRIDRRRRQNPIALLKAYGITEEELLVEFKEFPELIEQVKRDPNKTQTDAQLEVFRRTRLGEPASTDAAQTLIYDMFFNPKRYDLNRVGRYKLNKKLSLDFDPNESLLQKEDLIGSLRYLAALRAGHKTVSIKTGKTTKTIDVSVDDIDHFGNRRVRTVGELLQNQIRIGLARMERIVRERMGTQDVEAISPQVLLNIRPISASLKEFLGTSQLSQFMDQNNPLAGLTHKRRLSALGPGGLSRDRATMEVRDVHPSHYGRMCPIESPEGQNIGLMGSLATYGRVNSFGFIETPYRKVKNGKVTDEIHYFTADDENKYIIAQANAEIGKDGKFIGDRVLARDRTGDAIDALPEMIDYMDISTRQLVSVATSLIPFVEHDDANRALMGTNMQRQAVPLIRTEAPLVGTGMEFRTATDSGDSVLALASGVVKDVSASNIEVANDDGTYTSYALRKFERSNQTTCYNQNPIVDIGERVEEGSVIADGPAISNGELALGKNLLIAFMSWEGYNFEDAIILSERVVKEDILTSIHIEEHEIEARETKLGEERITRELPNVSEQSLANLDERGIIRIGSEVKAGDILVGKVTPKGEQDLTPEERLLKAIFGGQSNQVRDTSLRVPHGEAGTVVSVTELSLENDDDLQNGVNSMVRVYIAQRRKITIGDKLSGRHGNKGVISRILPEEDMPFLEDGTPVDVILNPLGVPGRMNVGQVLEVHLGMVAKNGWDIDKSKLKDTSWKAEVPDVAKKAEANQPVAVPVFDGISEEVLHGLLTSINPTDTGKPPVQENGKAVLFDGRTGDPFPEPISVGYMYILKLHHLVDDKIHARSTGPYSMITQQPLGGKAQFGGQRFGEMEVWALEAYGAAYTLHEMMTLKSDDVVGRVKVYEAIVRGDNVPDSGIPESFKVLLKEIKSLCLNVRMIDSEGNEISMETEDDEAMRISEGMGINLAKRPDTNIREDGYMSSVTYGGEA